MGGENKIINHELVFQHLKNYKPEYLELLSQPYAMSIPRNIVGGKVIRKAQMRAVFSFDAQKHLLMSYTKRERNINWHPKVVKAKKFLDQVLDDFEQQNLHVLVRLKSGNGIIANNVLHARQKFEDNPQAMRVFLRARYYDYI